MEILRNREYADALKAALVARANNTITPAMDKELGNFLANIVRWALAELVTKGKLWRTVSQDEDFSSDILAKICYKLDKLDLTRESKEILVYLKKMATNYAKNAIRDMSCPKRNRTDVSLADCDVVTNLYGNRI